jgi:hypothetical protein
VRRWLGLAANGLLLTGCTLGPAAPAQPTTVKLRVGTQHLTTDARERSIGARLFFALNRRAGLLCGR